MKQAKPIGARTTNRNFIMVKTTDHTWEYEHRLIAEEVLGKRLPLLAEIYHVDDNRSNNANNNLVICQDHEYLSELRARRRVARLGLNPFEWKFVNGIITEI